MIFTWGLLAALFVSLFAGNNAQGSKLRIVSILDQPYLMHGDDGDRDNYIGFCNDLSKMISDELKRDYEIHLVKDGRYGTLNTSAPGKWIGMIGEIVNNEADLAVAPLTITAARAAVVDFTTPFQEFQFSILLKKPNTDEDKSDGDETLTIFSPFHLYLWLSIICTMFVLIFISLVMEWSFKSPETHGEGFVNFLRQDSIFRPESISGKVVRFVYLVFIVIVISAYTASFAVQRKADSQSEVSGIDSIKELVTEDDMTFGIIDGGSTEAFLKESLDATYSKLYEIIDRENTTVENYAEGLEKLRLEGRFAFVIESPKAQFFSSMEPCDLQTASQEFGPTRGYAIATRNGTRLSHDVNIAILKLKEKGQLETLINKYWNNIECSDTEDGGDAEDDDIVEKDDFDTLNLSEMAGLFYFVFSGLILILFIWVLERRATSK